MEKDSKDPSSDNDTDIDTENQDSVFKNELKLALMLSKQQHYNDNVKSLDKEMENKQRVLINLEMEKVRIEQLFVNDLENFPKKNTNEMFDENAQFPPPDTEFSPSPEASPIREPEDLPTDMYESSLRTPVLAAHLNQPDQSEIFDDIMTNVYRNARHVYISENETPPLRTSNDKLEDSILDDEGFAHFMSSGSEKRCAGKGKEAKNPKFRYKKRSKPEVSSVEASRQETLVKHSSKEASGEPGTITLELESLKADTASISPAGKRKILQSDDQCSTGISKLSGNRADDNDNLKIAKKLKFDDDDDEKPSMQCPTITALVSQKTGGPSYIEKSRSDSEQLALPSTSGLIKTVNYSFSSEESFACIETEGLSHSEREELSLTSGSEDVMRSEKESSLTSGGEDMGLSEREELSLTSGSEDVVRSETEGSSLTSESDDPSQRGKSARLMSDIFGSSSSDES